MIRQAIEAVLTGGKTLAVIDSRGELHTFTGRGVSDLFRLTEERPELLKGAFVADRIVGRGAAALMALGGISELYTPMISRPALELLLSHGVRVNFDSTVDNIRNRAGTGICPVETLCLGVDSLEECRRRITSFINSHKPTDKK